MTDWPVIGFTSTASKRPESLYGAAAETGVPLRMSRASGCRVWDDVGRDYIDCVMALGAVALGYAHAEVNAAAHAAMAQGVVGPLPPVLEAELAEAYRRVMPWLEQVRFHKTGAEACAAALKLARAHTGREMVLGCGYHGWLDLGLSGSVPYNDVEGTTRLIREAGDRLAAVIVEPVIEQEPAREWLDALRAETARTGALLVLDELKTVCRVALGGATERYGLDPDLVVLGKAIGNGFPLALVGGRRTVLRRARDVWISSTLATEFVSLAAARAVLGVMEAREVPAHLHRVGSRLFAGFARLASAHPGLVTGVAGIPEMCFLRFRDDDTSSAVAVGCAHRGVLLKRSAYNFVSLAHDEATIDLVLGAVEETLRDIRS